MTYVVSYLKFIETELQNFQIELSRAQKDALAVYCQELHRWNQTVNMTALSGSGLVQRLVIEPVWIAHQLALGGSLTDIGSGNGSPAIPFQIVSPLESCQLVESRVRRAAFLRHVAATLRLHRVAVYRGRFQDIAATLQKTDWISLRAVALDEQLAESMRLISTATTTIVWITSQKSRPVLDPIGTLTVPITGSAVFLFRLDLT